MPSDFSIAEADAQQVGAYFANDARYFTLGLFLDEDRYYSQAFHIFWARLPIPIEKASQPIYDFGKVIGATDVSTLIRFGQDIFTPNDLRMEVPMILDDRPFSGWLHFDLAKRFYLTHWNRPARLHFQIDMGLVGPASFADQVQIEFHEYRRKTHDKPHLDPDPSAGWAQQYGKDGFVGRTQLAVNYGIGVLEPSMGWMKINWGNGAHIHTGSIYGNMGVSTQVRLGLLSRSFYQPISRSDLGMWEAFLFGQCMISAVGWNYFLTGAPNSQVKLARGLMQNEFGLVVRAPKPAIELSLALSMWSRETKSEPRQPFQSGHIDYRPKLQDRGALFNHGFGTFRLSWLW